jgi:hypothetical protein
MEKSKKKQTTLTQEKENQSDNPSKFRLIKNENWHPARKPKVRIKPITDDLPLAA